MSAMSGPWRVVLIVSIALNLFLIGAAITVIGGKALHRGGPLMRGVGAGGFPPPSAILQSLPEASRDRLGALLGDDRKAARQSFRDARAARRNAFKALTAEPYSAEDMSAALKASREADLRAIGAVHDITGRIVGALTAEERIQLSATIEKCMAAKPPAPPECGRMWRRGQGREGERAPPPPPDTGPPGVENDGAPPTSPADDTPAPPPP